jgi:hypothetical protein
MEGVAAGDDDPFAATAKDRTTAAVAGAVASGFFGICDSVVPTYPRRSFLLRGN